MQIAIDYVKGAADYETLSRKSYTAAIPCATCKRGDVMLAATHKWQQRKNRNAPMPVNSNHSCAIPVPKKCSAAQKLEVLIEWARDHVSRIDERAAAREAQFAPFDAWNSGG